MVALIVHIIAVNNIFPIVHSHSRGIKLMKCRIVQSIVILLSLSGRHLGRLSTDIKYGVVRLTCSLPTDFVSPHTDP